MVLLYHTASLVHFTMLAAMCKVDHMMENTFMYAAVILNYNKVMASYPNHIGLQLLSCTNIE